MNVFLVKKLFCKTMKSSNTTDGEVSKYFMLLARNALRVFDASFISVCFNGIYVLHVLVIFS